jgi:thiamine-phosphate pyrophosphorylase
MSELPRLYVILDIESAASAGHTVVEVARAAFEAGARFFQCRFKELDEAQNERLCREVLEALGDDATVVVNGRTDLAVSVGAAGVHLRSTGGSVAKANEAGLALAGRSCHSLFEAERAADEGADFITMSPVFRSRSKPDYGPTLGLDAVVSVCSAVDVPVYALAGITPERVKPCLDAGAHGVAVMSGICGAENVAEVTRRYVQASPG